MDEAVLRARIVTHEWQHASVSVKKVATALFAFLREAQQGGLDGAAAALTAARRGGGRSRRSIAAVGGGGASQMRSCSRVA